jgi:hypothetical protein
MAGCARGVCSVMASLCCCGMPLCRLAMGTCLLRTMVGSLRSMACSAVRSTSISHPTPYFLMGACGLCGLSGPTWMMLWRRMLIWRSSSFAHRICPPLRACPSHCTQYRTAPTYSGRLTWMRQATSIRSTTTVGGCTRHAMPSTCSSCSTTPSASLPPSSAILVAMPRTSTRRSVIWPHENGVVHQ